MPIRLTDYSSAYWPTIAATATMYVRGSVYKYINFDYGVFMKVIEDYRRQPGKILNWLKRNAETCERIR